MKLAALVLVGHEYVLGLYTRSGSPLARTQADYRTFQSPVTQGGDTSFSFRVAN